MTEIRTGILLRTVFAAILGSGCISVSHAAPGAKVMLVKKGFTTEWVDALTAVDDARTYSGEELKYIGMPVGGLFAGQIYLGGDGRLWYWDIFNQRVLDPGGPGDKFYKQAMLPDDYRQVRSGFLIDYGDRAELLDGRGFEAVRFRGEYPIAKVDMTDEDQPVRVTLEAFSPFVPTCEEDSSIPTTLMSYRLTNTSDKGVKFRLGGWLENASNRNAVKSGSRVYSTEPIQGAAALLLGANSVRAGDKQRPNRVLADFESGYEDWKADGDAFGSEPFIPAKHQASWQAISRYAGKALVNSHNSRIGTSSVTSDNLTGTLTSPPFTIDRNFLTFTVAGGSHDERGVGGGLTAVEVLVGESVVATIRGKNSNVHRPVVVNLAEQVGKQARIRIVDTHQGAWGHIQADQFVLTDAPVAADRPGADTGTMAFVLLGREGESLDTSELPASWRRMLAAHQDSIPGHAGILATKPMTLKPGASTEVRLAVCWHFPNGHLGSLFARNIRRPGEQRNYYAKKYEDAGAIARDLVNRHEELVSKTRLWRDTWYGSTLPRWFLDRTFINASTLASTASARYHDAGDSTLDGRVYFWEGVYLGQGTCTHVTQYEQIFGRLFPSAARAQRSTVDYNAGWDDRLGYIRYRAEWGIGHHFGIPHAIDGHAGTITRTYREHTTAPDNAFLASVWPRVKRAVQFQIDQDAGRGYFEELVPIEDRNSEPDGLLTGPQYNTLDKVWDGKLPWISGLYLASLRAAAEMATDMGDHRFAAECRAIADRGRVNLAHATFNKDYGYFVQRPVDQERYVNSNRGCHTDQMLGEYWAGQLGLDSVFPLEQGDSALQKIVEHNLYARVGEYQDQCPIKIVRRYADRDEPGTIVCSFPHGGERDAAPGNQREGWDALVLGYFSESWTGQEYPFAAALIDHGMVVEGLAVCRATHQRYAEAPLRRNPFNEIEYGNHYTRAMSSYGPFVSISGFTYHGPRAQIDFAPKLRADDFKAAFVAGQGWGSFSQTRKNGRQRNLLELKHGTLRLQRLNFSGEARKVAVTHNDGEIAATLDAKDGALQVQLAVAVTLEAGDTLAVSFQ